MRWGKFKSLIPFLIGVTLVGILAKPLSSAIPGINLLMSLSPPGEVKLKRLGWKKYQPTTVGTPLRDTDSLLLTKGAKAQVMCQNLAMWKVPDGKKSIVSNGCPPVRNPRLVEPGEDTGNPRDINNLEIPYLITPRDTNLLPTQSLTLSWNQVEGAKNYRVHLIGPGVDWSQETTENQLVYGAEPPLKPGNRYWFTVKTDRGQTSTFERTPGFSILSEKEVPEILAGEEEIKHKQLSQEAQALALAHLYQSNQLYNKAINLLKTAIQDGVESVAIYQLLGEVYQQVGLNRLAREHYLKGLELAKAEANLEGLAIIQGGLAITNAIVENNEDQALNYLQNAKAAYQELGDEEKVRKLEEDVADILGGK